MTRTVGFMIWLATTLMIVYANVAAHRQAQQPRQCPPECADCGHSWGPSNKPWCKLKNMKGMK